MKRFILCTLLVVAFGVYSHVQAQFKVPRQAWGVAVGGAIGDNSGGDKWGIHGSGFFQYVGPNWFGLLRSQCSLS
jgi:hypothetical protein